MSAAASLNAKTSDRVSFQSAGATQAPRILEDQTAALQAELAKLRAENAALKERPAQRVTLKVSEKGCVSLYGLGRFPVALYASQWLALLDHADPIRAFIEANKAKLAWKE